MPAPCLEAADFLDVVPGLPIGPVRNPPRIRDAGAERALPHRDRFRFCVNHKVRWILRRREKERVPLPPARNRRMWRAAGSIGRRSAAPRFAAIPYTTRAF